MKSRSITFPKRPRKEYCLESPIRQPTLTKLCAWIESLDRKHVHWLYGERYSGSSTVLYNAAYYKLKPKDLPSRTAVASFSFGSAEQLPHDKGNHDLAVSFVATIVCQLIRVVPALKSQVATVARSELLHDDATWDHTEMRDLVEALLIGPHKHIMMTKKRRRFSFFILLDDLHCCTSEIRAYILDTMAQTISEKLPVYYLIAAPDDLASGIRADFEGRAILRNALKENKVEPWPKKRTTDASSHPPGAGTTEPPLISPSELPTLLGDGKAPRRRAKAQRTATQERSDDGRSPHCTPSSLPKSVRGPEIMRNAHGASVRTLQLRNVGGDSRETNINNTIHCYGDVNQCTGYPPL